MESCKGYFFGKDYLDIGPNATADYEIAYNPLTMTAHE